MAFEIFAFYLKLFEICDYKSNCNKTLTIEIGPFRRWPPKKILLFFSENDLFSDAIEKIGVDEHSIFQKRELKRGMADIYVTVNCGNQSLPGMPEIFSH